MQNKTSSIVYYALYSMSRPKIKKSRKLLKKKKEEKILFLAVYKPCSVPKILGGNYLSAKFAFFLTSLFV